MRLTIACLALAFSLAATGAASAADGELAAAFKTICINTHGDTAAAEKIALGSGWEQATLSSTANPGLRGFKKNVGEQNWTLALQVGDHPADGDLPFPSHRSLCVVSLTPDTSDVRAAVRAYMDVDPSVRDSAFIWAYVEHGATREFVKDMNADFSKAVMTGPTVVIGGQSSHSGYLLMFTRVTKIAP